MRINIHLNGTAAVQIKDDGGSVLRNMTLPDLATLFGKPFSLVFVPGVAVVEYDGKTLTFFDGKNSMLNSYAISWATGDALLAALDASIGQPAATPLVNDALAASFVKPA